MMKFSSKIEKCGLSPMRKFAPYAAEAVKKGKKVYHLNIGQPDIATPEAYFEAGLPDFCGRSEGSLPFNRSGKTSGLCPEPYLGNFLKEVS